MYRYFLKSIGSIRGMEWAAAVRHWISRNCETETLDYLFCSTDLVQSREITTIPDHILLILELRFHWHHSWLPHIKEIKAKSLRALNILKYLSHPTRGCSRKRLLPVFPALVRSILDYDAPLYGLAPHSQLSLLNSVQNAAIRYCTGAFRTSLASSLNAEAGIPPLP